MCCAGQADTGGPRSALDITSGEGGAQTERTRRVTEQKYNRAGSPVRLAINALLSLVRLCLFCVPFGWRCFRSFTYSLKPLGQESFLASKPLRASDSWCTG